MASTQEEIEAKEEIKKAYQKYREVDPFPKIPPALLNSGDVEDYIKKNGIIYPYENKNLSGITLQLRVGEKVLFWDEDNKKVEVDVKKDGYFTLKSNSIAYVQIFEEIRLPAYIIVRFNLRVTNAYKGILLGTGPIIDPGFAGRISIPLHNLTNNDYHFTYLDGLIEMEFTKVSPNKLWAGGGVNEDQDRKMDYKKWKPLTGDSDTEKRNILSYLFKANQGNSIHSSLPPIIKEAKNVTGKVEKLSDKVDTSLSRINIGMLFSFGALLGAIIAIVNIFRGDIKEIKDKKFDEKIQYLQQMHQRDSLLIDSLFKKIKR